MDLRRVFAANLRRLRTEKGFSQEEVAHRADVNRGYISTLESGKVYVGLEIIEKLAELFGVEGADLLKKPPTKPRKSKS